MTHRASADFWDDYDSLSKEIQVRANKQFALLKSDPAHGSLQFKKIGIRDGREIWSVRVTLRYRALAFKEFDAYVWFWIGEHGVYDTKVQ